MAISWACEKGTGQAALIHLQALRGFSGGRKVIFDDPGANRICLPGNASNFERRARLPVRRSQARCIAPHYLTSGKRLRSDTAAHDALGVVRFEGKTASLLDEEACIGTAAA